MRKEVIKLLLAGISYVCVWIIFAAAMTMPWLQFILTMQLLACIGMGIVWIIEGEPGFAIIMSVAAICTLLAIVFGLW